MSELVDPLLVLDGAPSRVIESGYLLPPSATDLLVQLAGQTPAASFPPDSSRVVESSYSTSAS